MNNFQTFISHMDASLTLITTPSQNEPGSNGNGAHSMYPIAQKRKSHPQMKLSDRKSFLTLWLFSLGMATSLDGGKL